MFTAITSLALTVAPAADSTLPAIALGVSVLALLVAFVALNRARRAGKAADVAIDEALTAAVSPVGSQAVASLDASEPDERQLVAVISAAIAAVLADEQGAGAPAPRISSIRRIGPATTDTAGARTSNGPYPGFVVRRIRRV